MSTETAVETFVCPNCKATLETPADEVVSCACGWRGSVYSFNPIPPEVNQAEVALSDDAVCSNHPSKKATAICAGTGDYICELCRVDLKGETYSIQYLDAGGQEKVMEAYSNTLPRPDRLVITLLFLSVITFYGGIVLIPIALFYYPGIFKLRRNNPVFRRLVSRGRALFVGFALALFLLVYLAVAIALGVAVYSLSTAEGQRHFREALDEQNGESMEMDEEGPPEF
ncbi:hypothetical protein K2Y11_06370 [bacterium]|nr:hypothetical protein [bacterium]